MDHRAELPVFTEHQLASFVYQLRDRCFGTQGAAGKHFRLHASTISRNESTGEIPQLGYIAELVRQVAARAEDEAAAQQHLLAEINKLIRPHYHARRITDWLTLSQLADDYMAKRRRAKQDRAKQGRAKQDSLDESASAAKLLSQHARIGTPTYNQLVGVDTHIQTLCDQLTKPEAPWIISLEGLGGIGKTSLATAVARRLIDAAHFADFGWVNARTENLNFGGAISPVEQPVIHVGGLFDQLATQLATDAQGIVAHNPNRDAVEILKVRLKQAPHLVVIDNLETVADIEILVPQLQALINPSKFLLTTRESLYNEPSLYNFQLNELSLADALQLMRQEGATRNAQRIVNASDIQLTQVYKVVGGNPLALRLLVGQTHNYALDTVLSNLLEARGEHADALYTYIYFEAWKQLSEDEQTILITMPLVTPSRADVNYLATLTDLSPESLDVGLARLIALNLIDSNQATLAQDLRFSIHSLTRSFLHKQIVKWT